MIISGVIQSSETDCLAISWLLFMWSGSVEIAMSGIISDYHSVLQQDHTSGGDPYNRHKARLEEGHKDHLPRERKWAAKCYTCWSCIYHWWEAPQCVHSRWKRLDCHTENYLGRGLDRLHCPLDYSRWKNFNHPYQ